MSGSEKNEFTCHVCGNSNFEWGTVQASGLSYFPENSGFLKKAFSGGYKLKARLCKHCKNIQIFKN